MSNILDLDTAVFSSKLQQNVKNIYKKYGSNFFIKYNDSINLPVFMKANRTMLGKEYYELDADGFYLEFFYGNTIGTSIYIASIRKMTNFGISGSDIVKFVLYFLRQLGTHKAYLIDRAYVRCAKTESPMDLSIIKLINNGLTFYTKLGFELDYKNSEDPNYKFSRKKLMQIMNKNLEIMRSTKISDILTDYYNIKKILNECFIGNCENLNVIYKHSSKYEYENHKPYNYNISGENNSKITILVHEMLLIGPILLKAEHTHVYLKELLTDLVNTNCDDFLKFQEYFFNCPITSIILDKTIINREYITAYKILFDLIDKAELVYKF